MKRLSSRGVDSGPLPGRSPDMLDHNIIHGVVRTREIDGAADTGTAISASVAVFILSGGISLEG